jgi:outer membrane lipopolysaccharide assembly protein LptE/RlpB
MTRFLLLAVLLFSGCGLGLKPKPVVPPDVVPVAEATIDGMSAAFGATYRRTCLDAAGKLRSGAWKSDREYLDGHRLLIKAALEAAGQPLAERQQREATPFTPDGMAAWLESVAKEGQP